MVKYIYVEHSHGEFEGTTYDNVTLSNGIRSAVCKNNTGLSDLDKNFKEGDEVIPTFETAIVKGPNRTSIFATTLVKLEKKK